MATKTTLTMKDLAESSLLCWYLRNVLELLFLASHWVKERECDGKHFNGCFSVVWLLPLQFTAWTLQWMLKTVKKMCLTLSLNGKTWRDLDCAIARQQNERTELGVGNCAWYNTQWALYIVWRMMAMREEKRMEMIVWRWRRQKGKESSWNVYILCKFKDVFEHI